MYIELRLLSNALLLGIMTSFLVVTSPAVFKTLDGESSKKFLRFIFPRLFNYCFLISMFIFLSFALGDFVFGMIFGMAMAISFLINTYVLTPRINKMRDLVLEGHTESGREFKNLHRASVFLYLLNMIFILAIFIFYYIR